MELKQELIDNTVFILYIIKTCFQNHLLINRFLCITGATEANSCFVLWNMSGVKIFEICFGSTLLTKTFFQGKYLTMNGNSIVKMKECKSGEVFGNGFR